MSFGSKYEISY